MDDLRSLAEAAEELGLAPVTLRAAIGRGRFRARKFGTTWVTTTAEVERYRREHLGQVGRPSLLEQRPPFEDVLGTAAPYVEKGLVKGRVDPLRRR